MELCGHKEEVINSVELGDGCGGCSSRMVGDLGRLHRINKGIEG
jgi:hypothetical protein